MLIIVEGPDCAGKSTFAQKLAERLDIAVWHRGPPTEHPLDEYEKPLMSYRPGGGLDVVCDRWHVGEWVYPAVIGRDTQADIAAWWHIELFLAARGALVVYVLPELDVLIDCVIRRGDSYIDVSMLKQLRAYFLEQRNRTTANSITTYSYPTDQFLERVLHRADVTEWDAARIDHNGSYIGPTNPRTLFVGERSAYSPPYPPAFGPFKSTSGHWMLMAFASSLHRDVGFANVGEEDISALWESIGKPKTVALGHIAHKKLLNEDVPHGAIPHPQYVRRFHHREQRWYVRLATKAMTEQEDLLACRP